MQTFSKSGNRSLVFGMFTFFIPITIGYITCRFVLGFNPLASLLVSSMFSTHTLISYPIVSRFRITKIEPVGVAIGGTIITDTLVLFLLVVITALAKGNLTLAFWVKLSLLTLGFLGFIIFIFPKIGKWFFKNMTGEPISQYVFVLTMVFFAGILAKFAGIEPIIGAFLAGITFNRLVPQSSTLMNRIEFIGNSLFIPFFLVYVGMLINLKVFVSGWTAIETAIALISVALATKWIAAWLTQKIFMYKTVYRNLLFGLSSSHAAATIAVILIGYKMSIIDINVLNATIILILVTCMVSSFVTEHASRQIVINEKIQAPESEIHERFLVPISNPETVDTLIEFASLLKTQHGRDPIFTLTVVKSEEEVATSNALLNKAILAGSASEHRVEVTSRVDVNIAMGIIRACKELMISDIVLGWSGRFSTKDWVFGSMLENILEETKQPIFVTGLKHPLNTFAQISVLIPSVAEFEPGFNHWLKILKNLANQTKTKLVIFASVENKNNLSAAIESQKLKITYMFRELKSWDSFFDNPLPDNNLLVIISARRGSVSYSSKLDTIPKHTSNKFKNQSFVIVYPSQAKTTSIDSRAFLAGTGQMPVEKPETIIRKVE